MEEDSKKRKKSKSVKLVKLVKLVKSAAALHFRPDYEWTREEALSLYTQAVFPFPVDQIFYQDCIEGMATFSDHCIDLVVADPPFGIDFDGISSVYHRKKEHVVEGYQEISSQDYAQFTQHWLKQVARVMKPTASAYIVSGWTHLLDVLKAIEKVDLHVLNHIIWKYPFGVFTRRKFVSSHYHILFLVKNPKRYFFNKMEHYPLDVWEIPRKYHRGEKKNGTKLPLALVEKFIDFSSRPGDSVLDPFMGNGTTAVVAKTHYRHYVGFEINEKMKEIIIPAIENNGAGKEYIPYTERVLE